MLKKLLVYLILLSVIIIESCRYDETTPTQEIAVDKYEKELVYRWIDEVIKLGQVSVGFSPPVAARGYGYTALALYETLLPGMPENISMKGQIVDWQGLNTKPDPNVKLHWGLVVNTVMANMCLKIPAESNRQAWKDEVVALEAFYNDKYKSECTTAEYNASIAYGKACSDEVYAYSKTDPIYATIKTEPKEVHNSNFPVDYVPPTGPGKWRPTFPLSQGALQPYWGVTRPFLKKNIDIAPPPPNEFSMDTNSIYYKEMMEVYTTVKGLTPEQRIIGLYWDDAPFKTQTPGGHSIKIYNQLMKENEFKISTSVESFLKVSMAVHDAFVNCWKYKYTYNTERPISYLRDSLSLQDFTPIIATPPFPDYCSGHSNQSGAAMTVFQNQFGANYTFTDSSHVKRSDIDAITRAARTYNKFSDMYNEVAMSRLYAGIHFRKSIEEGVKVGQQIGQNIWDLKYKK